MRKGDYDIVRTGRRTTRAAPSGDRPKISVVNRYLQSWDASNLFIAGAPLFRNSQHAATGPVGALACWAADAILKTSESGRFTAVWLGIGVTLHLAGSLPCCGRITGTHSRNGCDGSPAAAEHAAHCHRVIQTICGL